MDARTWRGDGVAGWKYPSLLEDFQTDTASMARKRHLASSARGFYCFCLMSHWRNRGEVNVLTHAVPWSFTVLWSVLPRIDTLLAFWILLLTIWIFQVLLESLKIHRGRPRSNLSDAENSPKWPWFVKKIEKFFPGRSTIGALVGRPQTLWSVDQANFEWNGPKTESLVNDFLHKRAKMCNSDFLDCKLKSQKFNYRFDSILWFYVTLWYQEKEERIG